MSVDAVVRELANCQGQSSEMQDPHKVRGTGIWLLECDLAPLTARWAHLGISALICVDFAELAGKACVRLSLKQGPLTDTRYLMAAFELQAFGDDRDLEREIVLSMLGAPQEVVYPNEAELAAAIRIRINIVKTARKAELDFHTEAVDRPQEFWSYRDGHGFVLKAGKSLVEALKAALHPDVTPGAEKRRYAFSCYRATEYVMLLGLALELQGSNPQLLVKLEDRWRSSPIASREFHETFLREHGSMAHPLPFNYYVPGDRVWFRNPDEVSSDVSGYEGSWVIYLGGGFFTNFWDAAKPYTLTAKCVELFHWRDCVRRDNAGELHIDEEAVAAMSSASIRAGGGIERILERMVRYRDPGGVYSEGGCIDSSREHMRWVLPVSGDVMTEERGQPADCAAQSASP